MGKDTKQERALEMVENAGEALVRGVGTAVRAGVEREDLIEQFLELLPPLLGLLREESGGDKTGDDKLLADKLLADKLGDDD